MTRRDFSKHQSRENVTKRGYEPASGGMPLTGTPRRKPSKQQLRMNLDAAMASVVEIKRVLRCDGCDHQFAALQPIEPPFPPLTCPRCGGDV
jgi:hypothetical protein